MHVYLHCIYMYTHILYTYALRMCAYIIYIQYAIFVISQNINRLRWSIPAVYEGLHTFPIFCALSLIVTSF